MTLDVLYHVRLDFRLVATTIAQEVVVLEMKADVLPQHIDVGERFRAAIDAADQSCSLVFILACRLRHSSHHKVTWRVDQQACLVLELTTAARAVVVVGNFGEIVHVHYLWVVLVDLYLALFRLHFLLRLFSHSGSGRMHICGRQSGGRSVRVSMATMRAVMRVELMLHTAATAG